MSEVQLIGTITASGTAGGSSTGNVSDGDFTTRWDADTQLNGWIGNDAGVAVVPKRFLFATGDGVESRMKSVEIQADAAADFSSAVTLDTVPTTKSLPRYQWHTRTLSGSTGYRYLRSFRATSNAYGEVYTGGYGGSPAEIRWIIASGTAATSRPCWPDISPKGAHFPTGSGVVVITCPTTTAAIYYTTDGSTPTTSSTPYTAPLTLIVGVTTTLKAIAHDAALSTPLSEISTAVFHNYGFRPNDDIVATNGVLINAFGGNVTLHNGYYYLVGAPVNQEDAFDRISGVWLYKSTDLYQWEEIGEILDNPTGPNGRYVWVERPKIVKIDATHFVLWAHGSINHGNLDRVVIASASSPEGPWTWVNSDYQPDGDGCKDCNVFQDDDGYNYFAYTGFSSFHISRMSADGLSCDGTTVSIANPNSREAPILFKRRGVYFLITSKANYYDPNQTYDIKFITNLGATPVTAWPPFEWPSAYGSDIWGTDPVYYDNGNLNGQPTCVIRVPGSDDQYIYVSDRWVNDPLYDSRPVWLPVAFFTDTSFNADMFVSDKWNIASYYGTTLLGGFM